MFTQPLKVFAGAITALITASMPATAAPGDSTAYHLYPTDAIRAARPVPSPQLQNATPFMLYYGGPVLSKVKVVSVIWGSKVNKTTVSSIGPFYVGIVNSTFIDQLAQYATNRTGINGHAGTGQTVGRGSYHGQFVITPANKSTTLTDAAVQKELKAQIAANHLPPADLRTLYMVYFPAGISISVDGIVSCRAFSAYHSASVVNTASAKNIFYGIFPDCGADFAHLTVASSHELAEAVSDAIPTPGSNPAYPQAWNTKDGYEIGDLCQRLSATSLTVGTKSYAVTNVFLNSTKACSKGPFKSP
jgi:hypothetical protein